MNTLRTAIFDSWDITRTEQILADREKSSADRSAKTAKLREAEKKDKEDELGAIQKEFDAAQKQVNKLFCEVEKRISEHDNAVLANFAKLDITEGAIDQVWVHWYFPFSIFGPFGISENTQITSG